MNICGAIGELVPSSSRETAVSGRGRAILNFRMIHAQIEIILDAEVTLSGVRAIISCGKIRCLKKNIRDVLL